MSGSDTPSAADQGDRKPTQAADAAPTDFPICGACGSERVVRDAWASWNRESRDWEASAVFDHTFCLSCEAEAGLEWRAKPPTRTERIRMLNDALRTGRRRDGTIVITAGIQALGPEFVAEASKAVAAFTDFDAENDPHHEHDFGSLTVRGEKLFFKLDYYDRCMTMHSPDPADPSVTSRVMTIMLASEY